MAVVEAPPALTMHSLAPLRDDGSRELPEVRKPGWFTRFLLRHTPVPLIVRSFLENLPDDRSCRFIEDVNLPPAYLRYLRARGIDAGPRDQNFFLYDRSPFRAGLIVSGRRSPYAAESLWKGLAGWLATSGRDASFARVLTIPEQEVLAKMRQSQFEPICFVVWTMERSPLERLLGSRPSKQERLMLPVESPAIGAAPPALRPRAAEVESEQRSRPAAVPVPARHSLESPANESTAPKSEVHQAGVLQYRIAGSTRGGLYRRYCLRRDGDLLKISMLSSKRKLSPDYALAFFDRLQFAPDCIREHRELLRSTPSGGDTVYSSLSLELRLRGSFRCIAAGMQPAFFREKNGRLYLLPDSTPEGEDTVKIVEGRFHPGDGLLIVPGGFTVAERRELAERFRQARESSAGKAHAGVEALADLLSAWLDYRLRGRALFVSRGR